MKKISALSANIKCFFNKLTKFRGFLVAGILYVVLVIGIIHIATWETSRLMSFTEKEIIGIKYIHALSHLLEDIQERRYLMRKYLKGEKVLIEKIALTKVRINEHISSIDKLDKKYGSFLRTKVGWSHIKTDWRFLKSKSFNFDIEENYAENTLLIEEILSLIRCISDTSNLIIDPDIDSYYLMDSIVLKFHQFTEKVSQLACINKHMLLKKSSIDLFEKQQQTLLRYQAKELQEDIIDNLQKVFSKKPSLKRRLKVYMQDFNFSTNIFFAHISNLKLDGKTKLSEFNYKVMYSSYNLISAQMQSLENLLINRKNKYVNEIILITVGILFVSALAAYYFGMFYVQKKEADELRKMFLATLAHDLKSPLISVQKALELIKSRSSTIALSEFNEYLEDIYYTNEEVLKLVVDILSISQYEGKELHVEPKECNIEDIIENSVKIIKYIAKEKKASICIKVGDDVPHVQADETELIRVIVNLIVNAIKHNRENLKISIEAQKRGKDILVSVSDNGMGIPENEKELMFEKYKTAKRKVGTGLGLYLSKQIIEAHKGKIWFDSEINKGTTFYFTLPT